MSFVGPQDLNACFPSMSLLIFHVSMFVFTGWEIKIYYCLINGDCKCYYVKLTFTIWFSKVQKQTWVDVADFWFCLLLIYRGGTLLQVRVQRWTTWENREVNEGFSVEYDCLWILRWCPNYLSSFFLVRSNAHVKFWNFSFLLSISFNFSLAHFTEVKKWFIHSSSNMHCTVDVKFSLLFLRQVVIFDVLFLCKPTSQLIRPSPVCFTVLIVFVETKTYC